MSECQIEIFDTVKISLKQYVDVALALGCFINILKIPKWNFSWLPRFQALRCRVFNYIFPSHSASSTLVASQARTNYIEQKKERQETQLIIIYTSPLEICFFFVFPEFKIKYSDLVHKLKLYFSLFRLGGLGTIRYQTRQVEHNCKTIYLEGLLTHA